MIIVHFEAQHFYSETGWYKGAKFFLLGEEERILSRTDKTCHNFANGFLNDQGLLYGFEIA